MKRGFVFCVCGNQAAHRVNTALGFLKRFTKLDIVVVKARTFVPTYHDQVIECRVPGRLSDLSAGLTLKTNLHRMVSNGADWCYLAPDVIAVDERIEDVFKFRAGPVSFARDLQAIDALSPEVMNCRCAKQCRHLRQGISSNLSVRIRSGSWAPWDPSMFLFGSESMELLDLWHQFAAKMLGHQTTKPRPPAGDQWALAAAAWKTGLQDVATLPKRFYRVVDGLKGIAPEDREEIDASQLFVDRSYSLRSTNGKKPVFLHFLGGTVGRTGWKNWDDLSTLAGRSSGKANSNGRVASSAAVHVRRRALTPVHGMWIGSTLSRMELLTLKSFVHHGHRFHLWAYDQLVTPVPDGVVIEDASEILPREAIVARTEADGRTGVGAGSFSAPFSDVFRYKLLYEKGGYWSDMDVTCLKPFPSDTPYLFRSHPTGVVGNVMKCPRGSKLMAQTFEETSQLLGRCSDWLAPNRILTRNIDSLGLSKYIRGDFCSPDAWSDVVHPFIENDFDLPPEWFAIHWMNELWRTLGQNGGRLRGQRIIKYKIDKH
ncbi:MAG TPA: glycosyltransferase, partial [Blastocatellia bacterium]